MRAEAPLGIFESAHDEERQHQIHNSRHDEQLIGRKSPGHNYPRDTGQIQECNCTGKRTAFEHQDDFIAIRRQRQAKSAGHDDAAQHQEARHAERPRRLDLTVR